MADLVKSTFLIIHGFLGQLGYASEVLMCFAANLGLSFTPTMASTTVADLGMGDESSFLCFNKWGNSSKFGQ